MSRTVSAPRMGKRLLALLLSAGVGLGLLPQTAFAAQTGSSGTDRTVFDALGFSTGAPEGYEQEEGITDTKGVASGSSYVDVKDSYVYGDAFAFEKYTVQADGTFTKGPFTPAQWTSIPEAKAADRFAAGRAGWVGTAKFTDGGKTYTVTVSGALTLAPSFAPQQGRTVTLGEKIAWMITRGGEAVETDEPALYPGESITLTAQPRDGDMVESWTVNGAPAASTAKTLTYTYAELEEQNEITVAFKPVTYFTVHFGADIAAKADGTPIADGDEVAAGSRMEFAYTGSGYVEQWKNGEDVIGGAVDPLVIDPLTDNLNITVAAGEREVFTVTDENSAPEHYTAVLTGAYEAAGGYVEGSDVTIRMC